MAQFCKMRVNALLLAARDGHSSGTPVTRRLLQPTRTTRPGHGSRASSLARRCSRRPYSVLLPVGFAVPLPLPEARCALTAPFHPYLVPRGAGRSLFCGTVPEVRPRLRAVSLAGRYPAPHVHGARTFLPCHLSALARAAVRPTDRSGVGWREARVKGAKPVSAPRDVIFSPAAA